MTLVLEPITTQTSTVRAEAGTLPTANKVEAAPLSRSNELRDRLARLALIETPDVLNDPTKFAYIVGARTAAAQELELYDQQTDKSDFVDKRLLAAQEYADLAHQAALTASLAYKQLYETTDQQDSNI